MKEKWNKFLEAWNNGTPLARGIAAVILFLIVLAAFTIPPLIMMWLWNWLAVSLFSAPAISFHAAWGMLFILDLIYCLLPIKKNN